VLQIFNDYLSIIQVFNCAAEESEERVLYLAL